jgi:hypothetical protein
VACSIPTERLQPRYPLTVALPDEALRWRLLFESDTCLYLPVRATRKRSELDALIARHFAECGLRVPPQDGRSYIPIRLLKGLFIRKPKGGGIWPSSPCPCRIDGRARVFGSLNQLVQQALRTWTNRPTAGVDVFLCVHFYYARGFWRLDWMRRHIMEGEPLPEAHDPGRGTPPLPGLEEFLEDAR